MPRILLGLGLALSLALLALLHACTIINGPVATLSPPAPAPAPDPPPFREDTSICRGVIYANLPPSCEFRTTLRTTPPYFPYP